MLTIGSAYPHFVENTKRPLEPGKLAGLVFLDKYPLKVEPLAIKDIRVIETIKEGQTIYKAQ